MTSESGICAECSLFPNAAQVCRFKSTKLLEDGKSFANPDELNHN
jgi:hypothetical protein